MNKSLTEIQQENRRMILEAIHCVSYEEALEREFTEATRQFTLYIGYEGDFDDVITWLRRFGRPITLSRVLLAFSNNIFKNTILFSFPGFICVNTMNWNLNKETLEEQEESVQRKVWELLTKE